MNKTIVHIGLPRTATTWFQKNFFTSIENYTLVNRNIVQDTLIHPSSLTFNSDFFIKGLPENENLIISEEMISGRVRGGAINHLFLKESIARIKTSLPQAELIIFLRRQSDLASSMYSLYVQKGGTYSKKSFLEPTDRMQELNLFSPEYLNYKPILEHLLKVFGRDKIAVCLFEDFSANPGEFLSTLSARFNFKLAIQDVDFTPTNAGLSNGQLHLKRLLNRFTRHGIPYKHYYFHLPRIYNLVFNNSRTKSDVSKAFEAIQKNYTTSNKWVMETFDLPQMKKYGYCYK